jgi:hypothetical protein
MRKKHGQRTESSGASFNPGHDRFSTGSSHNDFPRRNDSGYRGCQQRFK